jgi:hypothetical protein
MRDDFSGSTKELVAKRVGYRCSNLGCRQPTSGPQEDAAKVVNIGVAAHITAASPDGPRHEPGMTVAERASASNAIWLCQSCAKLVDNDPLRYPVAVLREWKLRAESLAARELEERSSPGADTPFTRLEGLMPALLSEMREDLAQHPLRREFVLLKRAWVYWASGTEFLYYFDDHQELESKVRILENEGLVHDITSKNVSRYRVSERLARYLGAP